MSDIEEFVESFNEDALMMDGYDDCIVGMIERFGNVPYVAYDYGKVIDKLIAEGMTSEEAEEYLQYNMLGAYVGESTPCFIHIP